MVSTVVTTAVLPATIGAITVAGLIALLVISELADASERPPLALLNRYLAVFTTPLLIVFASIVVIEVLRVIS